MMIAAMRILPQLFPELPPNSIFMRHERSVMSLNLEGGESMSNGKENSETKLNPNGSGTRRIANGRTKVLILLVILLAAISIILPIVNWGRTKAKAVNPAAKPKMEKARQKFKSFDDQITANANKLIADGRKVFRFNTFGDEKFWGDTLQLQKAIEGANFGGVGPALAHKLP